MTLASRCAFLVTMGAFWVACQAMAPEFPSLLLLRMSNLKSTRVHLFLRLPFFKVSKETSYYVLESEEENRSHLAVFV